MKRLIRYGLSTAAMIFGLSTISAGQVSLSFDTFSLHSGTDLQAGAVYCFTDVAGTTDAEVEILALANGATLDQIDDANTSSAPLQPQMTATPNLDGRVDLAITLVSSCGGSVATLTGLEISAVDVDGSTGRQEFVELTGVQSYTLEGTPASLLTVSTSERGLRFLGPETTFTGIDPAITEVIAVANAGNTRRIPISIGQTGTSATSGVRLFSLDFTVDAITFTNPQVTNLTAQIGTAMAVGSTVDNGNGTYDIPLTVTIEGFDDVSLFDIQITNDLATSFGTHVAGTPVSPGTYTVNTPSIGTLAGGATIDAGSPNSGFDGSGDQNLLTLVLGNVLPVGGTAEISFTVTWYPPVAVTSTTNQATGRGDFSEDGTSDGSSTDASHEGNDPDPDSDGPGDNSTVTTIDISGLPVELADFRVTRNGEDVTLSWTTYSESGNSGFDVQHRGPMDSEGSFRAAGFVAGAGDSQEAVQYRFDLANLEAGVHEFRLRQKDLDGAFSFSEVLSVEIELTERFTLEGAYPNPFNPVTSIRFALKEAGPVMLSVFDVTGRQVRSLAAGSFAAGTHQVQFEAGDLPSGLYVYRLETESGTASMPVVLLK